MSTTTQDTLTGAVKWFDGECVSITSIKDMSFPRGAP